METQSPTSGGKRQRESKVVHRVSPRHRPSSTLFSCFPSDGESRGLIFPTDCQRGVSAAAVTDRNVKRGKQDCVGRRCQKDILSVGLISAAGCELKTAERCCGSDSLPHPG